MDKIAIVSLDNGANYVAAEHMTDAHVHVIMQYLDHGIGSWIDDNIRERLHGRIFNEREFAIQYVREYCAKYNEALVLP